jgi:hypothetical protein
MRPTALPKALVESGCDAVGLPRNEKVISSWDGRGRLRSWPLVEQGAPQATRGAGRAYDLWPTPSPPPTGQTAYRIPKRSRGCRPVRPRAPGPGRRFGLVPLVARLSGQTAAHQERLRRPAGSASRLLTHDALSWVCSYQGKGAGVAFTSYLERPSLSGWHQARRQHVARQRLASSPC